MLGDLPLDARHVRGAPREDIGIGAEEVDEHHFLFVVEGSADLQRLAVGGLWVKGDVLGTLGATAWSLWPPRPFFAAAR